jgi:hypothetical protein
MQGSTCFSQQHLWEHGSISFPNSEMLCEGFRLLTPGDRCGLGGTALRGPVIGRTVIQSSHEALIWGDARTLVPTLDRAAGQLHV